jgi:integrase
MDKGVFISRAEAESTTLKELLERYLDEITPLKKGAASETNRLRALPRNIHGQAFPCVTTEAIKRAYIRAVRRAGIEDLRFHDLRHEATTRLFEKGLNIMEVASITGHKDLRTLRRYTHLKAEDLAKKHG